MFAVGKGVVSEALSWGEGSASAASVIWGKNSDPPLSIYTMEHVL